LPKSSSLWVGCMNVTDNRQTNNRRICNDIRQQEIRSVKLGVCPMQLFHFWSCDVHSVQNLQLCTKIKIAWFFHWDMTIYRFSKWRPSAILELFYHHTRPRTKFLLLYAAACQISSQSDTQIWRYSYLNFFAYLAWNAYSGPQNGVFGGLWTPKCDYSSSRPPKAHPCVNLRLISRVCKYGYPLSGYPDLSTNFMAAENLDILKWKSGFFGCMKIVKTMLVNLWWSVILVNSTVHCLRQCPCTYTWCPCIDCIKERLP